MPPPPPPLPPPLADAGRNGESLPVPPPRRGRPGRQHFTHLRHVQLDSAVRLASLRTTEGQMTAKKIPANLNLAPFYPAWQGSPEI